MEKRLIQYFRIILSVVFVFSAIAKLVSLAFFDGMVAELLLGKLYYEQPNALFYVQILTRVLISLELFLGVSLLQTKKLKSLVLPLLQLMLVVFTAHLFYVSFSYMVDGKSFREAFLEGNCGCFGDIMPMSNFESIIKNIISMGLVTYLWMKIGKHRIRTLEFKSFVPAIVVGLVTFGSLLLTVKSYDKVREIKEITYKEEPVKAVVPNEDTTTVKEKIVLPVAIPKEKAQKIVIKKEPVKKVVEKEKSKEIITPKLTYNDLLAKYTSYSGGVKANLNQGEKLVCMFSLSCGHCQETYKEICEMSSSGKLPNTLLLLYGTDFELNHFFNQAGCKHPYILFDDYNEFKKILAGHDFPYVLARNKGVSHKTWDLENKNIGESIAKYYGIEKEKPKSSPFGVSEEDDGLFGG